MCGSKIVTTVSAEFESSNGTLEKKDEIILNSGNDEPIGDGMSTILRRPRDQQQPMTNGSTSQKWDIEVHSNPVVDEQVINCDIILQQIVIYDSYDITKIILYGTCHMMKNIS